MIKMIGQVAGLIGILKTLIIQLLRKLLVVKLLVIQLGLMTKFIYYKDLYM